jgi:hypothetical protein
MRRLAIFCPFFILAAFIFVFTLVNPSSIKAKLAEPCQACIGGACVKIASVPYCDTSLNECSPVASCSNDCGCYPTPTPTPTPTPNPTTTPLPYNCTCGLAGNCIPLDGNKTTTGCHDDWFSGCNTGGCSTYYSRWKTTCDNPPPTGGICGYSCRYDTQCLAGNVCANPDFCRLVQGSNYCGDFGCRSCERQTNIRQCLCDPANPALGYCVCSYICNVDPGCGACPTPTGGGGTPTPTPSGSCTVTLLPSTAQTSIGSSTTLTATVTVGSGTVNGVAFSSADTGIATVDPALDTAVVYSTMATGVADGSTTVTADVLIGGAITCSDSSTVNVAAAGPWWQVKDSDVTTNGDIVSPIPGTCTLPVCNPVFGLKGTGGFPGVPVYGGAYDFQAGTGSGVAAEAPYNWLVNSLYSSARTYDFSYFKRQIPADVIFTEITTPTVNGGDFNSGGAPSRGYVWYHYDGSTLGDMTISGNVNLTGSRRVVLLVEGADLYITGRINIQSAGNGFFMAVVGKDTNGQKGNIIVDPSVSHPTSPGIEGVFMAEGQFRTGAGTSQLWVRGAVAAYDGFLLERDLGADNANKPAELFEYAPDIISVFPQIFTSRRMRWKEVAP